VRGSFHNSRAYLLLAQADLAGHQYHATVRRNGTRPPAAGAAGGADAAAALLEKARTLLEAGLQLARDVEDAPCECLAMLRLAAFYSTHLRSGGQGHAGGDSQQAGGGAAAQGRGRGCEAEPHLVGSKGGDLLLQSLKLAQELQDLVGQSNVLEAMGTHLARWGPTTAALEAWTECLELRKETGFVKGAERVRSLLEAAVKAHPLETDAACSTPLSRAPSARDPQ